MEEYDEDAELDRYVWRYHADLFSDFELRVQRAQMTEVKASHASESMGRMMRRQWGAEGDPEVAAVLGAGWPKFRSAARARVLRDHADDAVVNRCSACLRVLRTPQAMMCLWCGHDWH